VSSRPRVTPVSASLCTSSPANRAISAAPVLTPSSLPSYRLRTRAKGAAEPRREAVRGADRTNAEKRGLRGALARTHDVRSPLAAVTPSSM
jgi:hypothetical protein